MIGWRFSEYEPEDLSSDPFERLLKVFQDLLVYTSGNIPEALSWLTELDKQYKFTTDDYGMADFIQDLIDKGYIKDNPNQPGRMNPTAKMEIELRKKALDDVFDQLKKSKSGNHITKLTGQGDESTSEMRPFQFGDRQRRIALGRNA